MQGNAAAMEAKHVSDEQLRFRKDSMERKLGEDSLLNGVKDPIGSMQLLGA